MKRIPYAGAETVQRLWSDEELELAHAMRSASKSMDEIADALLDRFSRPANAHDVSTALRKYRRRGVAA